MTVAPSTRRELLTAGLAGAALTVPAAAALTAPAITAAATTATERPDPPAGRLRRLLAVEQLMLYCYEHVLAAPFVSDPARPVLALQARHEQAHIRALTEALQRLDPAGAVPAGPTDVSVADRDLARRNVAGRLGQLQGEKDALHLLLDVERVVGGAYFVALTKLAEPSLITLAVTIMAAEAQHEALLGELLYPTHPDRAVPYGLIQGTQ